jgi:hypothetical protein
MKITITKQDGGKGELNQDADGRYTITLNGKTQANLYYTQDQVDSIVAKARAAGSTITIED